MLFFLVSLAFKEEALTGAPHSTQHIGQVAQVSLTSHHVCFLGLQHHNHLIVTLGLNPTLTAMC